MTLMSPWCVSVQVCVTITQDNVAAAIPASDISFTVSGAAAPSGRGVEFCESFECEHTCWDPRDVEQCMSRVKPEETLLEALLQSYK